MNCPFLSRSRFGLALLLLAMSGPAEGVSANDLKFVEQTLDPKVGKVCYAVTLADVDGDKKQDVVAVTENRVLWFQAPDWKPRVIIADQTPLDNVCIAAHDIDGDGQVDFALGAGWTKIGTIHWLQRRESLDLPWQVHDIAVEAWTHRMRWADVLGTGKPQLVVSPLNATEGKGVRLLAFAIPARPSQDRWWPTVLDGDLNRMHNHWHVEMTGAAPIDTLTASQEGVHLVRRTGDGFSKIRLGAGAEGAKPTDQGAGEIRIGRLASGVPYIVTVEPMHGHLLAVYTPPPAGAAGADGTADGPKEFWTRTVIDEGFRRGHALGIADMDGDGSDDIIFGHSDTPDVPGVNVYRAQDGTGSRWTKHVVDAGGMATEDLAVADLNGDGRPDIVAGGRATHNVKLYLNQTPPAP